MLPVSTACFFLLLSSILFYGHTIFVYTFIFSWILELFPLFIIFCTPTDENSSSWHKKLVIKI